MPVQRAPLAADQGRPSAEKRYLPSTVQEPLMSMSIQIVREDAAGAVYRSRHFEFSSPVKLGQNAMKEVCRAFESTYELVSRLPWGVRPVPEGGQPFFRSKFFRSQEEYVKAGAPRWSAGIYSPTERMFQMPLTQVGVEQRNGGWSVSGQINNDVITHEVTHQMMHEYLEFMPIWMAEGLAEYTANLPYDSGRYNVAQALAGLKQAASKEKKERKLWSSNRQVTPRWIGVKELSGFTTSISKRNEITSLTFEPPEPPTPKPTDGLVAQTQTFTPLQSTVIINPLEEIQNLANRYYSSQRLVTYFMHLDGDGSGLRLKRYFDAIHEERKKWASFWVEYEQYKIQATAAQKEYEAAIEAFKKQPGVVVLSENMVRFPANLQMPQPKMPKFPTPPDNVDPQKVCVRHVDILLGGRTLEQLEADVRAGYQKAGIAL
jgi:hypothetical protein